LLQALVMFEIATGPCDVWLKLLQAPVMFGWTCYGSLWCLV
jgi:hypothetical protein